MAGRRGSEEKAAASPFDHALATYPEVEAKQREPYQALVTRHLQRAYSAENPYQLLLTTWNHPFGIGDFVHQLDFTELYYNLLKSQPHIKMQSICFISPEKQQLIKILLQGKDLGDIYFFDDEEKFDPKRAETATAILWSSPEQKELLRDAEVIKHSKSSSLFKEYIKKNSSVLHISRILIPSDYEEVPVILTILEDKFLQAIGEYGRYPEIQYGKGYGGLGYDGLSQFNLTKPGKRNYRQVDTAIGMGVCAGDAGIKFNENIRRQVKTVAEAGKAAFYKSRGEMDVLSKIIPKGREEDYFDTHTLAYGYLQEPAYFNLFVASVAATSDKSYIDIITNAAVIEKFKLPLDQKDLELLKAQGITSIEVIDGDDKRVIPIPYDEKPEKSKVLRFVSGSGMTNHQKEEIIALADVVAGSGDSSYSDAISAGKFPFFHSRPWKNCFFSSMVLTIEEARKNGEIPRDLSLLTLYFKYIIGFEEADSFPYQDKGPVSAGEMVDHATFIAFIKENHRALQEQFQYYAEYLHENRNLAQEQNKLFNRSFVISILEKGSAEEINELLDLMPSWEIGPINFVYYAAKHRLSNVLDLLFRKNPRQFIQFMDQRTPSGPRYTSQAKTPLELACASHDEKTVRFFLEIYLRKNSLALDSAALTTLLIGITSSPNYTPQTLATFFQLLNHPETVDADKMAEFFLAVINSPYYKPEALSLFMQFQNQPEIIAFLKIVQKDDELRRALPSSWSYSYPQPMQDLASLFVIPFPSLDLFMHVAVATGLTATFKALLALKPDFDRSQADDLLNLALKKDGSIEIIKILLEKGANINARDKQSSADSIIRTPLYTAVNKETTELIDLLLAYSGVSLDKLLCDAVRNNHITVVKLLLKKGANPDPRASASDLESVVPPSRQEIETPLGLARAAGYPNIMRVLLYRKLNELKMEEGSPKKAAIEKLRRTIQVSGGFAGCEDTLQELYDDFMRLHTLTEKLMGIQHGPLSKLCDTIYAKYAKDPGKPDALFNELIQSVTELNQVLQKIPLPKAEAPSFRKSNAVISAEIAKILDSYKTSKEAKSERRIEP